MKKISFDFDGCLSRKDVQLYAKELISKGLDVWIVTSRFETHDKRKSYMLLNGINDNFEWDDNVKVFEVANELGIPREKIVFTNFEWKFNFFKDNDFCCHLDDSYKELNYININSKTVGICCFRSSSWKNKCNKRLK